VLLAWYILGWLGRTNMGQVYVLMYLRYLFFACFYLAFVRQGLIALVLLCFSYIVVL